jgi:hypothetical protein
MAAHIVAQGASFQPIPLTAQIPPFIQSSPKSVTSLPDLILCPLIPSFMDLSFLRTGGLKPGFVKPSGRRRVPVWPMLRAASAAAQAASPTAQAVAGILRGQDEGSDWIQELADMLAPRSDGPAEATGLAGSFNPLIAGRLKVGQG